MNSIYLVMNYWPKEDYWLCTELCKRHIAYRLIGINNKVRMLRYAKTGGVETTSLCTRYKNCPKNKEG